MKKEIIELYYKFKNRENLEYSTEILYSNLNIQIYKLKNILNEKQCIELDLLISFLKEYVKMNDLELIDFILNQNNSNGRQP